MVETLMIGVKEETGEPEFHSSLQRPISSDLKTPPGPTVNVFTPFLPEQRWGWGF